MSKTASHMHAACCIFSKTVQIDGLSNPEGEIECSREKREETRGMEKEDKLKDKICVQFLNSSLSSVLRVTVCVFQTGRCTDKRTKQSSCASIRSISAWWFFRNKGATEVETLNLMPAKGHLSYSGDKQDHA